VVNNGLIFGESKLFFIQIRAMLAASGICIIASFVFLLSRSQQGRKDRYSQENHFWQKSKSYCFFYIAMTFVRL
jgi:hypothetical protein